MAVPTKIKFADFYEAVQIMAVQKGVVCKPYKGRKASAICFEFYRPNEDKPYDVFCVHEDRKKKVIYSYSTFARSENLFAGRKKFPKK